MKKTKLLKLREAAVLLGVNPETLRRWDRSGRLSAVRIGSRGDRRYNVLDINRIINSANKGNNCN
ncbi:hypothetical protein COT64_00750 [Candidatus Shapirobacteria bacterium CG09_land_8_20_14_0_10_39_12]|uniref:Helix-turn-helix domain-containing protein n=1 Tax=Candidatus Shapirobacteria bacterium CG09_land_8_20_14_0_10_39_12 TaxID=1974885 RepID=A0A2H0WQ95_9BACT|nr:MAG: hypothetical protein COT64_00750 [Candidatus Shapirobacteria bacterium CG09_land_8_20_14_0_10_39_12]